MACRISLKYYSKESITGLVCRLMVWHPLGFKPYAVLVKMVNAGNVLSVFS